MPNIDSVVQVNITRETRALTTEDFTQPTIVATHARWPERRRVYSSLASIGTDLGIDSPTYRSASALFSSPTRPDDVVVIRRPPELVWLVNIGSNADLLNGTFSATGAYKLTPTSTTVSETVSYNCKYRRKLTFNRDFVTGNTIRMRFNGAAVDVTYATSHADTFTALKDAIDAITGIVVVDFNSTNRTIWIYSQDRAAGLLVTTFAGTIIDTTAVAVTTGGASTVTCALELLTSEDIFAGLGALDGAGGLADMLTAGDLASAPWTATVTSDATGNSLQIEPTGNPYGWAVYAATSNLITIDTNGQPPTLNYNVAYVNIDTVANSSLYQIILNGTTYTYASDSSATLNEIGTGLAAAVNAAPPTNITALAYVADSGVVIIIGTDPILLEIAPDSSARLSYQQIGAPANSWSSDMTTAASEGSIGYYILPAEYYYLEREAIATWAAANTVITGLNTYVTDLASDPAFQAIRTTTNDRVMWAIRPASDFEPESPAASAIQPAIEYLTGAVSPLTPGTWTAEYKTTPGMPLSVLLTDTLIDQCNTQFVNYYTSISGRSVWRKGVVSSGEYIDVISSIDQLKSDIQVAVFGVLANNTKIAYTSAGLALITAAITDALNRRATGLTPMLDPDSISVTAPTVAGTSVNDRAARVAGPWNFTCRLAGAVSTVTINGTVTV